MCDEPNIEPLSKYQQPPIVVRFENMNFPVYAILLNYPTGWLINCIDQLKVTKKGKNIKFGFKVPYFFGSK